MNKVKRVFGGIKDFVTSLFQELKLTEFPSRKDTLRMTNLVIAISVAFTVIILGLDAVFIYLRNYLTSLN